MKTLCINWADGSLWSQLIRGFVIWQQQGPKVLFKESDKTLEVRWTPLLERDKTPLPLKDDDQGQQRKSHLEPFHTWLLMVNSLNRVPAHLNLVRPIYPGEKLWPPPQGPLSFEQQFLKWMWEEICRMRAMNPWITEDHLIEAIEGKIESALALTHTTIA